MLRRALSTCEASTSHAASDLWRTAAARFEQVRLLRRAETQWARGTRTQVEK